MKLKIRTAAVFVTVLVLCAGFSVVSAQQNAAVDSLFYRGVQTYEDSQYNQALEIFQLLDKLYPDHYRITASLLMKAKTHYKLQHYDQAVRLFSSLRTMYPESSYADDAMYGEATALYRQSEHVRAVKMLLQVVETGTDKRLQLKAARLSSRIMDFALTVEELKVLSASVLTEKSKAVVAIKIASKEIAARNYLTAKSYLQSFLEIFPHSSYDEMIKKLLESAEELAAGEFSIGVILPLSGPAAVQGRQLLDGIVYAVDQFNENNSAKIHLQIKDSQSNIVQSVRAAQQLCSDGEILAIIGELESDQTTAAAAVAQERGVPFFAPTASMDKIAEIGKYIFQLHSTLSSQAEQLARYIVVEQNKKKLAVFYPASDYGMIMRHTFVKTAEELGAEIIIEKWYFEDAENWENHIGTQIETIREAGIQRMIDDSLLVRVDSKLLTEEHAHLINVQGVIGSDQSMADLADSTDLAVTCIDALFLPVPQAALEFVIPQISSKNIRTQLLGGSDWYDLPTLNQHRNEADGVIFPSDYFVDESDYNYYMLRNNFRTRHQRTPGQLEIYGYDTVGLLLKLIEGKSLSRDNLCNAVFEIGRVPLIHGIVNINDKGYNESLHLLRYRNGKLIKVK